MCGDCGACRVQQALQAGTSIWPEPVTNIFWQCRECQVPLTIDEVAARMAAWWHYGQKYDSRPYIYHVRNVVWTLKRCAIAVPENVIAAAWLHDVVEDTPATLDWVQSNFGPTVEQMVDLVTNPPEGTRAEKHSRLVQRLRESSSPWRRYAVGIKLADRLCNMTESKKDVRRREMYVKEWPSLRAVAQIDATYYMSELVADIDELMQNMS